MTNPSYTLLAPHITPQQAALLRYGGALPDGNLAELCARLRAELAGIEALVAPPVAAGRADLLEGAYWPGTTLCADLTGFTPLAEALA
ncbi:MAG: hypothetical protein H7Y32_09005, partial [Chloroflexales bacterium]|nr:hypothetical protein [Chloroflexales bacterium]